MFKNPKQLPNFAKSGGSNILTVNSLQLDIESTIEL